MHVRSRRLHLEERSVERAEAVVSHRVLPVRVRLLLGSRIRSGPGQTALGARKSRYLRGSRALGGLGDGLAVVLVLRRLGDERGLEALLDRLLGDDALLHVASRGQLELDVEQGLLEDRAQATGAGLAENRLVRDRVQRVVGE